MQPLGPNSLKVEDLRLIESVGFQRDASPVYDEWLDALIWDDEWPAGLSLEGNEFVLSLITARSFLHTPQKKDNLAALSVDVESLILLWKESIDSGLKWSGFQRIVLDEKDRNYLLHQKALLKDESRQLREF